MGARMGPLSAPLLVSTLLDASMILPLAHETGFPHQEPGGGGGGTGVVLIAGVLFLTLATVGLLVWLDRRGKRHEDGD
jgi:hypothetical protein